MSDTEGNKNVTYVKRYKIGFRCDSDGKLNHLWDSGEMVNLNEVLEAIQTLIDQLATNLEWRNGAVLAYNAVAATSPGKGTANDR